MLSTNSNSPSNEEQRLLSKFFGRAFQDLSDFGLWLSTQTSRLANYIKVVTICRILTNAYREKFDQNGTRTPVVRKQRKIVSKYNLSYDVIREDDDEELNLVGVMSELNDARLSILQHDLTNDSRIYALVLDTMYNILLELNLIQISVNQAQRIRK